MSKELDIFYDNEWTDIENIDIMIWRLGSDRRIVSNIEIYRDHMLLINWHLGAKLNFIELAADVSKKEFDFIIFKLATALDTTKENIEQFIKYE